MRRAYIYAQSAIDRALTYPQGTKKEPQKRP
jgi:hypothetical protein